MNTIENNNPLSPGVGMFTPEYWGDIQHGEPYAHETTISTKKKAVIDVFSARRLHGLLRQQPLITGEFLFDGVFDAKDYPEGTVALFGIEELRIEREPFEIERSALSAASKASAPQLSSSLGTTEGLSTTSVYGQTYTFGAMWGITCATGLESPQMNLVPATVVNRNEETRRIHIGSFALGPSQLQIGQTVGNGNIQTRIPEIRIYRPGQEFDLGPNFAQKAIQSAERALGWRLNREA